MKCARLKLKSKLHDKIHACKDERRTYQAKRKLASRDTRRHHYDGRDEQRQYIDCNHNCDHAYNDKWQVAKGPHIHCSGSCDRKDDRHDNQPKKLGYEKPKSKGKVPCPIHLFLDKLAKHSWANCSENPANQKKPASQSTVDAHHTMIDNRYLSSNDRNPMG
jgi:hypothetical protein